MSLNFIQNVKSLINTNLPDNSVGAITPALLRDVLQAMTDALYGRLGAIFGQWEPVAVQVLTTTPTNYPNLYDFSQNLDTAVMSVDEVAGTITLLLGGYEVDVSISVDVDAGVGIDITAALATNGVPSERTKVNLQTTGAGERHSASIYLPGFQYNANDVLTLVLSVDSGTPSVNFNTVGITATVQPTYSAI